MNAVEINYYANLLANLPEHQFRALEAVIRGLDLGIVPANAPAGDLWDTVQAVSAILDPANAGDSRVKAIRDRAAARRGN